MTESNPTELERRIADLLHHDAEIAMSSTGTDKQYQDFVASIDSPVRRRPTWAIPAVAAAASALVVITVVLISPLGDHSHEAVSVVPTHRSERTPTQMDEGRIHYQIPRYQIRNAVCDGPLCEADLVPDDGPGLPQGRVRLQQADGTALELQLLDDPAPAIPGPGVVVIGSNFMAGMDHLYLVDHRAGTLRPMKAPADVRYWGPNVDEFLWGVTDDCRVFWSTNGTFEERQLDCSAGLDFTYGINADEFPPGWLQEGRMAFREFSHGQIFIHVSLDSGATWQRVPIGGNDNRTEEVLQQIG